MRRNNLTNLIKNTPAEGRNSQTTPKPTEEEQFDRSRGFCPLPRETWEQPKEPSRKFEEAPNEEWEPQQDEATAADAPDVPFSLASRAMFR